MAPVVTAEATAARLACHACGATGEVTREAGDVMDRIRGFACQHLDPHLLAVRFTGHGDLGHIDLGWMDA